MKSVVSFLIILFLIAVAGVGWGFYEFQSARGMKTAETITLVKSYFALLSEERRARTPKPAPENAVIAEKPPEPKPAGAINPPENLVLEETPVVTPVAEAPVTPTKVELRRAPKPEKPKVRPEAQELVEAGNKYYDQGVVHLQNTFKKDETFDKENDLAVEKFRQAMAKYLEAEKIDPDSLWLRGRIKDTNGNLITCRRQARRK